MQTTGSSTFALSLPKAWALRQGVKKGSELFVSEQSDGSLGVRTSSQAPAVLKDSIDVQRFSSASALQRELLAKYIAGYNVLRFHSSKSISSEFRKVIVNESRRLMGIEVVEETPHEIVIQDFFSPEGFSVDKTVRRAHILVLAMQKETSDILRGKSEARQAILSREDDVDRLKFLVLRQINLALNDSSALHALGISARECILYSFLIHDIETIADNACAMASIQFSGKPPKAERILELNERSAQLHAQAFECFLARKHEEANAILDQRNDALAKARVLEHALAGEKSNLDVFVDRIAANVALAAEIAELAIDRSL